MSETGTPADAPAAADPSTSPIVPPLRWLVVCHASTTWDDRDREWYTRHWSATPKLQVQHQGEWLDVPTVKTTPTR